MGGLCRAIAWTLLAAAGAASAAQVTPTALSHACNSCHGPGGHSPGAIPAIDGIAPREFIEAMRAFKSGARPSTIMGRIARAYSDAEIEAMAEYYRHRREDAE